MRDTFNELCRKGAERESELTASEQNDLIVLRRQLNDLMEVKNAGMADADDLAEICSIARIIENMGEESGI